MDMKDLIERIREDENSTKAEMLKYRAFNTTKTDEEWLELQKDIREYVETDPAEMGIEI
jgi:hypothetical protein